MTVPILRSYQRAALVAARASVDDGKRCPLVVSPTGSGKSTMAAMIVRSATKRERRCVWLAHRRELRDQAVETLDRCEVDAGHSGQGRHKLAQVVSTQGALVREEMPEADVVIVDEAHHYAADEWSRLLLAYPTQNIYGFTATPERPDGRGMGHMFDSLVVVAQPRELVEAGHLVDCGPENIYRPAQLQEPGFLTCSPLDAYKAHGEGGRNVVFAASIEQACTFAADFKKAGIGAEIVHGKLSDDVRSKALAAFSSGRVRVLVNVFVLTEGWDCPAVDVVTIARKMGSCAMYMQACGRGLRLSPGKDHMTLLDLAGVSHIHGSPLDDRIFSLDGIGMKLAKQGPRFCRACGNLLDEDGPCSKCKRSSRGAVSDPKYSRDPLEKYAKYKTDDEATRAKRLAKFLGQARAKRYSIGWAAAKYRHVYSVTPPYKIMALAKLIEKGDRLT